MHEEIAKDMAKLTARPTSDEGRVLVIDDEPVVADVLRDVLARDGYDLDFAEEAAAGLRLLRHGGPAPES